MARVWLASAALLLFATELNAQPTPQWVGGPWQLDASPARSPYVAERSGQVHIVYRLHDGGIGHITGSGTGSPTEELVIEGSASTAASSRPWNLPVVAVDESGYGHIAWGPLSSAAQKGVWYARIGPDGTAQATSRISDRWSEDIAIAVEGSGVHVLTNAIGTTAGVYDLWGSVDEGPVHELQAWQYGNFSELSLASAPWGGLALIGRFGAIKRVDLHVNSVGLTGTWQDFANHLEPPAPATSAGRPRIAFDGATELWATVAWIDDVPTRIVVSEADDHGWEDLSLEALYDPNDQDASVPHVGLAVSPSGLRAVAWLASAPPRLRFAIGEHAWGTPVALAGTDAANTFAICSEGETFRVVFTDEDGSLYTGKVGWVDPAVPVDAGPDAPEDAGEDAPVLDGTTFVDADNADDVMLVDANDADVTMDANMRPQPTSEDSSGCSCSMGGRSSRWAWLALAVVAMLFRRAP